jgi:hypothetical protein
MELSTSTTLLTLPSEIVGDIIDLVVWHTPTSRMVRLRAVCRRAPATSFLSEN